MQPAQDFAGHRLPVRHDERQMERAVEIADVAQCGLAASAVVQCTQRFARRDVVLGLREPRALADRGRLEREAQAEDFVHLGGEQRPHAKAAVRLDVDQAFGAQPHQRLAHRDLADAELGGDGIL